MFGFKAYFWDEQVAVNGQVYQNNEILNCYLNLPEQKTAEWLGELRELRKKTQLIEGGDIEFCVRYNGHVQRAQQLFFSIGNLVKTMPPYNNHRSSRWLESPLLFDCLNQSFFWEDGLGSELLDDKDDEYCNEYGFVAKADDDNYAFYVQHFEPHQNDLESDDPDIVLMLHRTNEAVGKLFDGYLTLVQDIHRVQVAYSSLLDEFIHAKRKFLNDKETAEAFTSYLQQSRKKKDAERLGSSGNMQMGYEVFKLPDRSQRLCETYDFDSLGAFLYVDFFRGLGRCYLPNRCDNCGQYFLLTGGKYSNYCERLLPDDTAKTCREVGARKRYGEKCKNDPIWLAYNRAYKAHYARYIKRKMTTAQFEQWSRYAVELREQAEQNELPQEDYERLIKI